MMYHHHCLSLFVLAMYACRLLRLPPPIHSLLAQLNDADRAGLAGKSLDELRAWLHTPAAAPPAPVTQRDAEVQVALGPIAVEVSAPPPRAAQTSDVGVQVSQPPVAQVDDLMQKGPGPRPQAKDASCQARPRMHNAETQTTKKQKQVSRGRGGGGCHAYAWVWVSGIR